MSKDDKPPKRGDLILMGRFLAAVDLLRRTGITEFEIRYDDDLGEMNPVEVLWIAEGTWKGHRLFSAHYAYPAQAAEDLLHRAVNGGMCVYCKQTTIVGVEIEGLCSMMLIADDVDNDKSYRYVAACGGGPS